MTDLEFLYQQYWWGVALWRLALAALLIALGLFSRPFLRFLVRGAVKAAHRTQAQWTADLIRLLPGPLSLVVHVLLWYGAGLLLSLPIEPYNVRATVMSGLLVAVAVVCTAVLFRLIDVAALSAERLAGRTATRLDDQLVPLVRKALKILLAVVVGIAIVDKLGLDVTSFVASLSIGGLALALAAKDTVANLFGSVVLFTDQPFKIGDAVSVSGTEGVIEEVGLRVTRVRQMDKSVATIPNHSFTTTKVVNYSMRTQRRIRHRVGLDYRTTPDQMQAFIVSVRTMLQEMESIDASTVLVHLEALDESSLGVLVQAFTVSPGFDAFMRAQETVLMNILRLVEVQGLSIAFPSRTVYLDRTEGDL